jgi:hypothetical protein
LSLCPTGFTCVSDDPTDPDIGTGTCQSAPLALNTCNPMDTVNGQVACSTGTYCKAFNDATQPELRCLDFDRPSWVGPDDGNGLCVLPVREGGACDSSWGDSGCFTCEPGTVCAPDPTRNNSMRCQRPCLDASGNPDSSLCPCNDGLVDTSCRSEDGLCNVCISSRNACRYRPDDPAMDDYCAGCPTCTGCPEWLAEAPYGCCDKMASCEPVDSAAAPELYQELVDKGDDPRVCCRKDGESCDADEQCCPGAACNADGKCASCGGVGEPPDPDLGCCPGAPFLRNGVCTQCDPDLVGTECADACEGTEQYECQNGRLFCPPLPNVSDKEDLCDGTDDNCDGVVGNDHVITSCDGPAPGGRCPGETFTGEKVCAQGQTVCNIQPGRDFCGHDGLNLFATDPDCGSNRGSLCPFGDDSYCGPYEKCDLIDGGTDFCEISPTGQCGRCALLDCGQDLYWEPNAGGPHSCP